MHYINKNCIDVIWMLILEWYSVIISCGKRQSITQKGSAAMQD